MQPYRPQVPAPYSKVCGGVYLLADIGACLYQFVFTFLGVGGCYCHHIQGVCTDCKPLYGFYCRRHIRQYLIEGRGVVAERLDELFLLFVVRIVPVSSSDGSANQFFVGFFCRQEVFAEEFVPVGEECIFVFFLILQDADVHIISRGNAFVFFLLG